MDWSEGRYEKIAGELLPAAEAVMERAAPRPGERVLDVGCGTGNAALLAAELGARATGVDPAGRLLEVAREAAAQRGLEAEFVLGDAGALPLADGGADVVVSVFGVIFAPDAPAAIAELARVTAPGGRIVLSAWDPGGAIGRVMKVRSQALAAAAGGSAPAPPRLFAWHDRRVLADAFARHGFSVDVDERSLPFTARSPEEWLDGELRDHPAWLAAGGALAGRGGLEPVRTSAIEVLRKANEDPAAFRVTSRYVIATARR